MNSMWTVQGYGSLEVVIWVLQDDSSYQLWEISEYSSVLQYRILPDKRFIIYEPCTPEDEADTFFRNVVNPKHLNPHKLRNQWNSNHEMTIGWNSECARIDGRCYNVPRNFKLDVFGPVRKIAKSDY